MTVLEASLFRDQSLRGHAPAGAEGFPRHYPPPVAFSLVGSRLGLRRYERVRAICLPDKEFRSKCSVTTYGQPLQKELHVAMKIGPSLPLIVQQHERAGVWSLRILDDVFHSTPSLSC